MLEVGLTCPLNSPCSTMRTHRHSGLCPCLLLPKARIHVDSSPVLLLVCCYKIMGDNYRVVKQPLETVRPFVYKQISLSNQEELDPDDPKVSCTSCFAAPLLRLTEGGTTRNGVSHLMDALMVHQGVEEFLEDRVTAMIEDALEDSRTRFGGDVDNPKLPLVRLKVSVLPGALLDALPMSSIAAREAPLRPISPDRS